MADELDKVVEELKRNAVVPLRLYRVPLNQANAVDPGPDLDFFARLERGEHLTDDFLKHAHRLPDQPKVDPETLAEWERQSSEAAQRFLRGEKINKGPAFPSS